MDIDSSSINFLENLDFFAKNIVEGFITGLHKSPFHGFSVEFAEHRIHNPGDSIKHVDWKLYARTDKMFTKRFEEETNLRCHLIIDSSSSMFFPFNKKKNEIDKFTFSILSSACLMNLFRRQKDAFGITLFSDSLELHRAPKVSKKHYFQLIYELEEKLKLNKKSNLKTDFSKSLNSLADLIKQRSLIIIFSDFQTSFDRINQMFQSLQHLKYKKHEILLFHVLDFEKEKELDFSSDFVKFLDLETSESIALNPFLFKQKFQIEQQKLLNFIKEKASQNKIDYFLADVKNGYNEMLRSYLIKRARLY